MMQPQLGWLVTLSEPPRALIIAFAMGNPIPVPWIKRGVVPPTIEFLENQALFGLRNSAALVGHAGHHKSSDQLGRYSDRLIARRILGRVFQQLHKRFL